MEHLVCSRASASPIYNSLYKESKIYKVYESLDIATAHTSDKGCLTGPSRFDLSHDTRTRSVGARPPPLRGSASGPLV